MDGRRKPAAASSIGIYRKMDGRVVAVVENVRAGGTLRLAGKRFVEEFGRRGAVHSDRRRADARPVDAVYPITATTSRPTSYASWCPPGVL